MYVGRPRVKTFEEWYPEYQKSMHYIVCSGLEFKEDAHKAIADAAFEAGKAYGIYCMDTINDGL